MTCTTHHRACDCREAAHAAEVERLRGEVEAAEDRALRFADLLAATCDALRGPPPPLMAYSWHDLPSHAAALREGAQGMAAALRRERELALRDAIDVCERVETVGLAEGADYCSALLCELLAGEG